MTTEPARVTITYPDSPYCGQKVAADYRLDKVAQDFVDCYVAGARAAVGDEAYEAAFREGWAMRFEHAVALARETRRGGAVARPGVVEPSIL